MAEKAALLEGYPNCHVCSETFRDPVSLTCNHSFCSSCLQKLWEQAKNKNCPICKRKSSKDYPSINLSLKDLADSFAKTQNNDSPETEKEKEKEEVVCHKHPEVPYWFCEGFSSGKHSWEVEVGDHPSWLMGLIKESADRKGECPASPEYGFWCLSHDSGEYIDGAGKTVTVKKRIRVQLDYDRGEVSFHNPEDMTHICTYRDTFTEKLFPYFNIGKSGDAKTTDIKICQTEISL